MQYYKKGGDSMANIYPTTVASKVLVAGDKNAGFFGEVPVSELWSGQELSSLLGITQGTLQYSNEPWLKFIIDGKVIYKSKKPFRHSISWNHLNEKGVVYGNKTIEDKYGNQYRVRLMKGALTDPAKDNDPDRGAKGSEWNRLMLPIHEKAANKNWAYPAYVEPEIPSDWNINYTDIDLVTASGAGNGSYQVCQEMSSSYTNKVMYRGYASICSAEIYTYSPINSHYGWSPVLELIQRDIFIKGDSTLHTKEGEKPFTQENLTEDNGYELKELDRKLTTFYQPLASESFYKKSTINLKKYFDIHNIGAVPSFAEKKIDFNMTSNITPAPYVASASSEYKDMTVYKAFNAFTGIAGYGDNVWVSGYGINNGWVKIDFGKSKIISKVAIISRDHIDIAGPKELKIMVENEKIIHSSQQNEWAPKERREFVFDKPVLTTYLKVEAISHYSLFLAIGEIEIYELVKE